MSKAYDQVNTFMVKKTLEYIKIPEKITKLLIDFLLTVLIKSLLQQD